MHHPVGLNFISKKKINGFMNVRIVIRICTILLYHLKIQEKSTYENFTMNRYRTKKIFNIVARKQRLANG
jgi:hypothetical protein